MTTNRSSNLSRLGPPAPIDLTRHASKCAICQSEDRQEIENLFLHWISPGYIVEQFRVRSRMTLYRHVHATGLYEYRRRNLRSALDRLIENADSATVSGDCIIRAIRAQSRVSEDGRWSEPVQRVVVSRGPSKLRSPGWRVAGRPAQGNPDRYTETHRNPRNSNKTNDRRRFCP